MTYKMKLKGFSTLILIALFSLGISLSSKAAINTTNSLSKNYNTSLQQNNWLTKTKQSIKHNFRSAKKWVNRTYKKVRKQQHDSNGIRKAGWGILMIIGGALVILGSILTFSGWGFVIGIGLVIWGAIKTVFGILGSLFNISA